jgi:hypothetical protein
MRRLLLRAVLALYPRAWRQRYGQELKDLLDDLDRNRERSRTRMMLSLVAGAAEERMGVFRAPTLRIAAVALVVAALAGVAIITVSASGHITGTTTTAALQANSGPAPVTTNGSQLSYGNPSPAIERQLQVDIQKLCAQISAGQISGTRRATAVELNPTTGMIVAKIVQPCDGSA